MVTRTLLSVTFVRTLHAMLLSVHGSLLFCRMNQSESHQRTQTVVSNVWLEAARMHVRTCTSAVCPAAYV
jgi:hypothetical protein